MRETYNTLTPVCPHCGHEFTSDDMSASSEDLWSLAPDERTTSVACPSIMCGEEIHFQGSYRPQYTTAKTEEELS